MKLKNSKEKRFNPEQGDDDNRSFDNLILLCRNHHIEIDNNINTYTVEYLKQIKKDHLENKEQDKRSFSEEELKIIFEQYNIAYYKKNPISIIPNYDIKKLIGRTDKLEQLHKMLTKEKTAILMNGIGGIGKTTVALAYCNTEKYQKEYQNIVWVTLTQSLKESIINTFIDKDIDFKYNEKEDTDKNFNHLLNTLRNITGNNLLVLDNANNDKEIIENKQLLEDTNWKILLTTRCLLDDEYTIKVDKLSEENAVKVFLQYCKIEDIETLKKLLFHIDYHTLLTELLAKTLKRSPLLDINKLYEIIKNQDISAPRIKKEIPIGVHAEYRKAAKKEEELYTYILGIFELEDMSEKENEYLRYFSILPSVEIYIEDLLYFFVITEEREIEFENTLNSLVQKGWIQENNKTYKMHQLIQTVIREKLKPDAENCKDIIIAFIKLLKCEPNENRISRKELIPFAESILNFIVNDDADLGRLSSELSLIFGAIGNYNRRLEFSQKAVKIYEEVFDCEHPELAISYNNIADTYNSLGNFEKSMEFNLKALKIKEKVFVEDHSSLATSYHNIGLTYQDLGNYEKALEYQKKSIKIDENVLVKDHPDLAASYNNIAGTYRSLGNYEKALEFILKAIKIKDKVLGESHPSLATSYNEIAITYRLLGDYEKALENNLKCIIIYEKSFEPNHPFLATSYNNIALTYQDLGNYEIALEYQEKSIKIREKVLDKDHPSLATSYNNIALTYKNLGQYDISIEYHKKSIEIFEKIIDDNPLVLANSYNNIASTYYASGNYEKAIEFQMKSIEIRKRILPEIHPEIAQSYNNTSAIYNALGINEKALDYAKMSLAVFEKVLEPEHPSIAISFNNIASIYYYLNDYKQAKYYIDKAVEIYKKALPEDHPDLKNCLGWQKIINDALNNQ